MNATARTIIATLTVILVFGSWWSIAQEDDQELQIEYPWELVLHDTGHQNEPHYGKADIRPIVSGYLYNKEQGPDGGVYALIVTNDCTRTYEDFGSTYCTGYQWLPSIAAFNFD